MLREISQRADRKDACDCPRHSLVNDKAADQSGGNPGSEAVWAGDQLGDRFAHPCSPWPLFYLPGTARAFVFCKWRAEGAGNTPSCHYPTDFLRRKAEEQ